jgi:hypothetical protein
MADRPQLLFQKWSPTLQDYDTGLAESGLLAQNVLDNAVIIAAKICYGDDASDDWVERIRGEFYAAYEDSSPDAAAAIVVCAQLYADDFQSAFDLLYMQGVALARMLENGGPPELNNFRMSAFQKALSVLPKENRWDYRSIYGKIHLAEAWQAGYDGEPDSEYLRAAYDLYGDLITAMQDGHLPFTLHAKAAELAALRAQTAQALQLKNRWVSALPGMRGAAIEPDPLTHWLSALELALDPKLRAADMLGYWDGAMSILQPWIDALSNDRKAKVACAAARQTLEKLSLLPDDPQYSWVQHHIGSLALVTGLQAEGLRTEANGAQDERELLVSINAYRKALASTDADDDIGLISTTFHLAYALHSLGEARRDLGLLNEAIGYYEYTIVRFKSSDDHNLDDEDDALQFAQIMMSMSEAIGQKAELVRDAELARAGLGVAEAALMGFNLSAHEEGIEAAQANFARISQIIEEIGRR